MLTVLKKCLTQTNEKVMHEIKTTNAYFMEPSQMRIGMSDISRISFYDVIIFLLSVLSQLCDNRASKSVHKSRTEFG